MNALLSCSSARLCLVLIPTALLCIIFLNISFLKTEEITPELQSLLDGECTQGCVENPVLIDHIQGVLVKPEASPHLDDLEAIKNKKGQPKQLNSILQFFNNKVIQEKLLWIVLGGVGWWVGG